MMEDANSVKSGEELQDAVGNCSNQVISIKSESGRETVTLFVPEEILLKIFRLLPGRFLHDMSRVCRMWRKVIRNPEFTIPHLSRSCNSPIHVQAYFRDRKNCFRLSYLNKDDTTWNLEKNINKEHLADGVGLIIAADCLNKYSDLCLLNPITDQIVPLPRAPIKQRNLSNDFAVGYSPSTSKYKVVYIDCNHNSRRFYILTVGVDQKWRRISVEPDILIAMTDVNDVHSCSGTQEMCNHPKGMYGFIYRYHIHKAYVIILDLEDEIFYRVECLPKFKSSNSRLIESDRILSIAVKKKYWKSWELVDYKNRGEWRKLGILDCKSKSRLTNSNQTFVNYPIFISGDEVSFSSNGSRRLFAYNFKSGMVSESFKYDYPMMLMLTNSLLVL